MGVAEKEDFTGQRKVGIITKPTNGKDQSRPGRILPQDTAVPITVFVSGTCIPLSSFHHVLIYHL